jgi:hypothetical protein
MGEVELNDEQEAAVAKAAAKYETTEDDIAGRAVDHQIDSDPAAPADDELDPPLEGE